MQPPERGARGLILGVLPVHSGFWRTHLWARARGCCRRRQLDSSCSPLNHPSVCLSIQRAQMWPKFDQSWSNSTQLWSIRARVAPFCRSCSNPAGFGRKTQATILTTLCQVQPKSGRRSAECDPTMAASGPNSAELGRKSAELGPSLAECEPRVGRRYNKSWLCLSSAQLWPIKAQYAWPNLAGTGRMRPNFGRSRRNFGRCAARCDVVPIRPLPRTDRFLFLFAALRRVRSHVNHRGSISGAVRDQHASTMAHERRRATVAPSRARV